jgi:hypothetical protein
MAPARTSGAIVVRDLSLSSTTPMVDTANRHHLVVQCAGTVAPDREPSKWASSTTSRRALTRPTSRLPERTRSRSSD